MVCGTVNPANPSISVYHNLSLLSLRGEEKVWLRFFFCFKAPRDSDAEACALSAHKFGVLRGQQGCVLCSVGFMLQQWGPTIIITYFNVVEKLDIDSSCHML